jgi:hypothetical protein
MNGSDDNGPELAGIVFLVTGIAAMAGAVYVGEWIAYVWLGLLVASVLAFFLWPSSPTS